MYAPPRVDADAQMALVRLYDDVTVADLLQATQALFTHEAWQHDAFDVLWDGRNITSLDLLPGDLERIVALKRSYGNGPVFGRDVMIVQRPLDTLIFELYRALTRREDFEVLVCHTLEEALAQVGRDALPPGLRGETGSRA